MERVFYENENVFAYSGGHMFCLASLNGSIVWENPLKGLGYGTCIIASEHQNASVISSQIASQQAVAATTIAATSAATSSSLLAYNNCLARRKQLCFQLIFDLLTHVFIRGWDLKSILWNECF